MPTTPFVPATNVMQVELRFTQFGQQVENVLYVRREDQNELGFADYEAIAAFYETLWDSTQSALQANSVVFREVYITDLTTATSPTWVRAVNGSGTSGSGLATNVTLTTTFITSERGRSSRGRNYWVGIPLAGVNGNLVDAGYAFSILAYYDAMKLGLSTEGVGYEHVIVSRRANYQWRNEAVVSPVIGYRHANLYVDSQRRRLTGRGL